MSKHFFVLFAVIFFSVSGFSQQAKITVKVKGIAEVKGMMSIALFSSEKEYSSKDTYTLAERVQITSTEFSFTFPEVPSGVYAVKIYHDVNSDEELDTNWIGMPKEPFGFSNDAKGRMGPPSFEAASFKAQGDTKLVITLMEL